MENAYGIGITNRYALFLDEDADPLDILKQSEADQKLAKAKKIEEATKPAPKTVKKEVVNNKNDNPGEFHQQDCIEVIHFYMRSRRVVEQREFSILENFQYTSIFEVLSSLLKIHHVVTKYGDQSGGSGCGDINLQQLPPYTCLLMVLDSAAENGHRMELTILLCCQYEVRTWVVASYQI